MVIEKFEPGRRKIEGIVADGDFVAIIPLCENDFQKTERYGSKFVTDVVNGKFEIL
ncbi:hypothetical protein AGMMS49938_19250 [Fibrobacterales bacterium]|nr:hypothetical protein AGMMS49938_19250 [Fibrobacterales bacterium]